MKPMNTNRDKAINKRGSLLLKSAPLLLGLLYISSPVQAATQHIVEVGDTLSTIASRYKVTQTSLIDANGLMVINVKAGQLLNIPDKDQRHNLYKVQSGDSISSLSKKYKINSSELARVNNLNIQSRLLPDSTLIIPATSNRSQ